MNHPKPEWDSRWIQSILPHRPPCLLVDRVLEIHREKRILALKNFTTNEEFFKGHFPGHPVVPGVVLLEALAQAGGILLLYELPERESKIIYFTGVDRARFRRPVVPGDQVYLEVELLRRRKAAVRLGCRALVGGEVAAEARCSTVMIDR